MNYNRDKRYSAVKGIEQILTDLVQTEHGSLPENELRKQKMEVLASIVAEMTAWTEVDAIRLAAGVLEAVNSSKLAAPLNAKLRIEDMHDDKCYVMSELDFENTDKDTWGTDFGKESYKDFESASEYVVGFLLVDDSDSVDNLIVHADSGTILSRVWMRKGQIWGKDIDSKSKYKIIHYDDTF